MLLLMMIAGFLLPLPSLPAIMRISPQFVDTCNQLSALAIEGQRQVAGRVLAPPEAHTLQQQQQQQLHQQQQRIDRWTHHASWLQQVKVDRDIMMQSKETNATSSASLRSVSDEEEQLQHDIFQLQSQVYQLGATYATQQQAIQQYAIQVCGNHNGVLGPAS
jgi:hypothetical protein